MSTAPLPSPGRKPRDTDPEWRQLCTARSAVIVLRDLDPHPITTRVTPDPYVRAPEEYNRAFDRIDRCLEVLLGAGR